MFPEQNDFYQQFSVEHLNYFSMQSLTNLMRRFGMRCIRHGSAGESFYTLWRRIDNAMTTPFFCYTARCVGRGIHATLS